MTKNLPPRAVSAIPDPGYSVTAVKNKFPVPGLSCALSVAKKLKAEPGVINASVNYANSIVDVEYIPGITNFKHFKKSIQSIGCDLNIDESLMAAEEFDSLLKQKAFFHWER